jgi:hypothetical protein
MSRMLRGEANPHARPHMTCIALLPARVATASVASLLEDIVSSPKQRLRDSLGLDPARALGVWSVHRGGWLEQEWHKLQEGMPLLFYAHKTFFARSTLVAKKDSASLTEHQWGPGGRRDPLLFVYTKPRALRRDVGIDALSRALHFKPGFVLRALRVLNEDQSAALRTLSPH